MKHWLKKPRNTLKNMKYSVRIYAKALVAAMTDGKTHEKEIITNYSNRYCLPNLYPALPPCSFSRGNGSFCTKSRFSRQTFLFLYSFISFIQYCLHHFVDHSSFPYLGFARHYTSLVVILFHDLTAIIARYLVCIRNYNLCPNCRSRGNRVLSLAD